jgi:hypothetical protein
MRLLALFALTAIAAFSQQIALTSAPVRPGATATITVTLSGSSGVAAIQWFLPAQSGMAATVGPATTAAGKSLACQVATVPSLNGVYGCIVAGGANALSDGVLATITLPAPSSPVPLPLTSLLGVNAAGDSPGIPIASGTPLVLASLSRCDVNGDGRTDLLDIRNVIDQIEGVMPPSTDLNGDGKTTLVDLQRVINAAVDGGTCRVGN